ncbi:hypothetical protein HanPI659440_Chr06g0249701 [Helianthus annuus]|uniref:Uncharacterized protein n=1 Tax=Helianthus annuus TaxID=4232 RepID=A0A9K3IVH6_HELAN|nr:hypothetical protein HanXRQr2_Chr06g0275271 [Helianthus annuus]KAJ0561672.1 hypothetical protein HanHA300_Chr06g0225681 [Helianthus annuus]KAJ0568412.1 hypothetical protein HanIR_Chr06g0295961 [Helianthus annuus]KAJ0574736.1 hypothetical protein HanHA89_Chr06g0241631 [Helianthus annuus]KAJ0739067.1 hypothetical protein HanLR1_Chr06g0225541 [Helianthus annuus]
MGWFIREGRSEQSWVDQTLGSISTPPIQLLAFFGLVIFLLSISNHSESKAQVERESTGLNLLLYLLPLVLVLVTYVTMRNRFSYAVQAAGLPVESGKQDGCSPWGVALIVVLVLVLVKYQS